MARFLRLSVRARTGVFVYASLGAGRDRVLDFLLDSLGDDRPGLLFGQAIWPPAERPTKLRADISSGVKTKADLFSRLMQATPGAALIASSDCGLPLISLVEASLRANVQLIYLAWAPQGLALAQATREIVAPESASRAERSLLARAIPTALPLWAGIEHAPDGSFCVTRVSEAIGCEDLPVDLDSSACEVQTQDLFLFRAEATSAGRSFSGAFTPTGFVPSFIDRLSLEAAVSTEELAAQLFDPASALPGSSGFDMPMPTADPARARRIRSAERAAAHSSNDEKRA